MSGLNKTSPQFKNMIENHAVFYPFSDARALIKSLGAQIENDLNSAIRARNRGSLIVSGGTTPIELFKALARINLPWEHITIGLADERWVDPSSTDSNEKLVRTHLLRDKASVANFIGMKIKGKSAVAAENVCTRQVNKIPSPFDVVILGLGTDGHTASWFPDTDRFDESIWAHSGKTCIGVRPIHAPHDRLTLTLPAVLNSRRIFVHIEGKNKQQAYKKAAAGGPCAEMPIRYILGQNDVPVAVYWAP